MIFTKSVSTIDPNKTYYCFYIKFSKSGFSRKIAPLPCYVMEINVNHYRLFWDKEKTKELGVCYDYVDYTSFSGIFETFEECVKAFNSVIDNRVEHITNTYNSHLDKLVKNIIKL